MTHCPIDFRSKLSYNYIEVIKLDLFKEILINALSKENDNLSQEIALLKQLLEANHITYDKI